MKRISVKTPNSIILNFESDGKDRVLVFNNHAFSILDEEFEGALEVINSAEKKMFSCFEKLIYAGLKTHDPELAFESIKPHIPFDADLFTVVMELVAQSMPEEKKETEEEKN